jgi:hypothetical protein
MLHYQQYTLDTPDGSWLTRNLSFMLGTMYKFINKQTIQTQYYTISVIYA